MKTPESRLKEQARALGFDLVGIAPAQPADTFDHLKHWLEQGFAGEMSYMARHAEARRQPDAVLAAVKSVIMVAMNYKPRLMPKRSMARVARYAHGPDYHDVLRDKLKLLLHWIQEVSPGCHGRCVVDTAPLLERDFARRAGLGWFGKNTMLIDKRLGSYFFLGAILLDINLQPDAAHETSHCGTCTACLDACPTAAFVGPGQLDARKCISYLTIELRDQIKPELRRGVGDWLFGCDVCQEVCPWNRKSPFATEEAWNQRPDVEALDLFELLTLTEAEFRRRFRGTALWRAGRRGLARNAAIVLGNVGDRSVLPALRKALGDEDPVVREAIEWAIREVNSRISA